MHAISISMWLPFTSAFLPMHSGHAAFRCGLALQKSKLLTSCKAKTHYQFKIPTYNSVIPLISFPYSQRSHVSSCYHRILSYCRAARSNRLTIGQSAVAHIMLCRDRDAKCVFRWLYSKSCWWRKQITLLAEGERREKPEGKASVCACVKVDNLSNVAVTEGVSLYCLNAMFQSELEGGIYQGEMSNLWPPTIPSTWRQTSTENIACQEKKCMFPCKGYTTGNVQQCSLLAYTVEIKQRRKN